MQAAGAGGASGSLRGKFVRIRCLWFGMPQAFSPQLKGFARSIRVAMEQRAKDIGKQQDHLDLTAGKDGHWQTKGGKRRQGRDAEVCGYASLLKTTYC